ncbi:RNA polymerase sigma factor [Lederbergia panacisoli]|uniref:RNA polymerase sigma factor n=1 Tax=Lederbergia panacisoli TaxID=1255251 RepID=UPI00214C9CE7|nr:RNA polymerase sigma factor [Lederbergia panacisoli]MCR2820506.1 RNA polymerase sigma factor [Lederbergia panacisoli]
MMKRSVLRAELDCADRMSSDHMNSHITEVYDRHVEIVYRVCFSILGNSQDAEDAVQTVFVKFMESKKSFIDIEHEKAWLIVTAKNQCFDFHRKWWKKKVVDYDLNTVGWLGTDSFEYSDLEEKLRKLPATHRLILYLHYYEGYKLIEIADMLDMNINTVKTRIRSAKKRLKLEIGDDYRG